MSFEAHVHVRKRGVEAGHREDCKFVDNHGPSCDCDGIRNDVHHLQTREHMRGMGWTVDKRTPWLSFTRSIGEHFISLSKVIAGWQYVWVRGSGITFAESSKFGTPTHALNDLWEALIARCDQGHASELELIRYKQHIGIYTLEELQRTPKVQP